MVIIPSPVLPCAAACTPCVADQERGEDDVGTMKSTDDLFRLIKSLDRNEKRYFHLYAARQNDAGGTDYLRLFDLIDGMRQYDEAALLASIEGGARRFLPQWKNYLHRTILRALNQYRINRDEDSQFEELLASYRILYEKGLFDQCRKVLRRARRLTEQGGRILRQMEILILEYRLLLIEAGTGSRGEEVDRIFGQMRELASILPDRYRMWHLQASTYVDGTRYGILPEEVKLRAWERLRTELPEEMTELVDPVTRLYALYALDQYYEASGNAEESCGIRRNIVSYIEETPRLRAALIDRHLPSLHNLCLSLIQTRRFSEFAARYDELLRLAEEARAIDRGYNDLHIRLLGVRYRIETREFVEARAQLADLAELYHLRRDGLRIGFDTYTRYLFAYIHFVCGDIAESLVWTNRIVHERRGELHADLYHYARLLELLLHYELGHWEMLESLMASVRRYLACHSRSPGFEESLLALVRRLLRVPADQVRSILEAARGELERLRAMPEESVAFVYLDLERWVAAKLARRGMAEMMREHAPAERPSGEPATRS